MRTIWVRNLVVLVVAAVVVGLGWRVYYVSKRWKAFAQEHHCRRVSEIGPQVNTGFGVTARGQVGQVTTIDPGKTGYLCDDGVTSWW